jgi:hypothetical protein
LAQLQFPDSGEFSTLWRVFRFAAVLEHPDPQFAAKIHVAIVPNLWARLGLSEYRLQEKVDEAIAAAHLKDKVFETQRHEWAKWPIAWKDTLLSTMNASPTLVVFPQPDGRLKGAVMASTMVGDAEKQLAKAMSAVRAKNAVDGLVALPAFADYHGWFKQANFDADNLKDLVAKAPRTEAGQFAVWIFEDDHWKSGLYHSQDGETIRLHSKTKPASYKPIKKGELLDWVRSNQTVKGDWSALEASIRKLALNERHFDDYNTEDFEGLRAVQHLCQWWNEKAPENAREAGCFRFYVWNPKKRKFATIGQGDEPHLDEEDLKKINSSADYTLFEEPGRPTVFAFFLRGRKHNRYVDGHTQVYQANGDVFWDIDVQPNELNEAFHSVMGLAEIQDGLFTQWKGWHLNKGA